MKIEVQEKFIKVTPDEGKLIYNREKPNTLMQEIYLPLKFTEAEITAKYAEISSGLFDGTESEPVTKLTDMRFSKLLVKGKLKELGLWDAVKAQLTEDEYEDLLIADDFAFDNELFVKVYESLKTQIENIDDLLKACVKSKL